MANVSHSSRVADFADDPFGETRIAPPRLAHSRCWRINVITRYALVESQLLARVKLLRYLDIPLVICTWYFDSICARLR